MFTGLVEDTGELVAVAPAQGGLELRIRTRIPMDDVAVGDSIAVDGVCLTGTPTDTFCKSFAAEWVFSIADFVRYLWGAENRGLKLLQVRFYPNQ